MRYLIIENVMLPEMVDEGERLAKALINRAEATVGLIVERCLWLFNEDWSATWEFIVVVPDGRETDYRLRYEKLCLFLEKHFPACRISREDMSVFLASDRRIARILRGAPPAEDHYSRIPPGDGYLIYGKEAGRDG